MPNDAWQRVTTASQPLRVKFGVDPTRDRLHVGHFVPLRFCRQLQDAGHELDLVLGTLTAQLGDPSGHDTARPILGEAQVKANAERLLEVCHRVLRPGFRVHRNHEFVDDMSVPQFLTELAGRTTVAAMLARDGFRRRMAAGRPIGLHELLVPLLQGWDSVRIDSQVEVGGTDQLFNFQVARNLQQARDEPAQILLMTPMIDGTDGRQMSKSRGNTIWLDEVPEEMFGQILSISDEVMDQWWEVFVDEDTPRPDHPRNRKHTLALDLITQIHGDAAARAAAAHFQRVVIDKRIPPDAETIAPDDLVSLVVQVRGGSKSAARRLIEGGGVRVDGQVVRDVLHVPPSGALVRVGRRRVVRMS